MLDVHILKHPDGRDWQLRRCLKSCRSRKANIHVLDGYPGHIGRGRVQGFSIGDKPFVTYVDDDDMVAPGTLDYLSDVLTMEPDAAMLYTSNTQVPATSPLPAKPDTMRYRVVKRRVAKNFVDHMCVFRRDLLEPLLGGYSRWRRGGDIRMLWRYVKQALSDDSKILVVEPALYWVCKD